MKNDFEYLTSLRGVAAIFVIFYHLREFIGFDAFLKHGYLAVDFFFTLSGFVLALTYQKQFSNYERVNGLCLMDFYIKRIVRIFPLHVFVLLAMLALYATIAYVKAENILIGRFSIDGFIQQLFLVHNWGFSERLVWNIPSWSISTEMFAYLVFPIIILGASNSSLKLQTVAIFLLLAGLALIYRNAGAVSIGDNIAQLGIYRCLVEFCLGIYVYSFYSRGSMLVSSTKLLLVGSGIFTIAFTVLDLPNYYYAPLLLLFVFYGCINANRRYTKILELPTLIWLGEISYSVYLIHYLGKDLLKFSVENLSDIGLYELGIYFVLVLGASHLTYKCIEMPAKKGLLHYYFKLKHFQA